MGNNFPQCKDLGNNFPQYPDFNVSILSIKNENLASTGGESTKFFLALLIELKKYDIPLTVAAKAIGESNKTVSNWKYRGSGAKIQHVHALVNAFPTQLKPKAEELGILEKPSLSNKDAIQLRIDSAASMVEEAEVKYRKALAEQSEELEKVRKEKEELQKQVEILMRLIDQKLK